MNARTGRLAVVWATAWLALAGVGPAQPVTSDLPQPVRATEPAPASAEKADDRPDGSGSGVLRLTLADALAMGLERNLAAVLAREGVNAAAGAREVARSGLMPSLFVDAAASRKKISLEQFGFPVAPGESPLIGPFDVVLGELGLSTAILDLPALRRTWAGRAREDAARLDLRDARDLVVTACAGLYLQAVAATSRVDAAQAQLHTAEALSTLARDMRQAGTVAGIEVLRADTQLAAQRQRLIVATNELDRGRLALARAIGLPLETPFELADTVPFAELEALTVEDALDRARSGRPDLAAARAVLAAAEDEVRAATAQRLPSVHLDAGLARVGASAGSLETTYSVAASVRVPLFEGGRIAGQARLARAELEQQRARVADLEAAVDFEVRTALLDLLSSREQVQVARGGRELAEQQLAQAEDRFSAGVASNIEVVEAQQALAEASERYIASVLAHELAKLALARSMGTAETGARTFLGGGE